MKTLVKAVKIGAKRGAKNARFDAAAALAEMHAQRPARLQLAVPGDHDEEGATPEWESPNRIAGMKRPLPSMFAGASRDLLGTLTLLATDQRVVSSHLRSAGLTQKEIAKNELVAFVDGIIQVLKDPELQKNSAEAYHQAIEAKQSGDVKKMLALCELRKESVNNYIRAKSHFLEMFFEETKLGQGDQAMIRNETMYPTAVYFMAQDGQLRVQRAIEAYSNFLVPLYFVQSQQYGYQLEDLQRGNVSGPALASVDISFDVSAQLDWHGFLLMTGSLPRAARDGGVNGVFGTFITPNNNPNGVAQQLMTYYPSPRVRMDLLPTTNDLTPTTDPIPSGLSQGTQPGFLVDSGGNPVIGFNVAHAVLKYCDNWADVFTDGALRPTGLLVVPAIDATSPLSAVTPTNAAPTALAEGLLTNYTRFTYGGITWTMIPDATIPRGYAYAVLNKPLGKNFTKPSFDREFVSTDYEANWEQRKYRTTQGLYVPVQNTVRVCRVRYY